MRRKHDFYPTPEFATRELLNRVSIGGNVFECCVGDHAISRVLHEGPRPSYVLTNDIDAACHADFHENAAARVSWEYFTNRSIAWVVTNPPFQFASLIVPLAYEFAEEGIAMLLRLSFLEPTEDRGAWLNEHPPTSMIVLPRISFTGDGKTDSVTCAWMIWEKGKQGTIAVAENPKFVNVATPTNGLFAATA